MDRILFTSKNINISIENQIHSYRLKRVRFIGWFLNGTINPVYKSTLYNKYPKFRDLLEKNMCCKHRKNKFIHCYYIEDENRKVIPCLTYNSVHRKKTYYVKILPKCCKNSKEVIFDNYSYTQSEIDLND